MIGRFFSWPWTLSGSQQWWPQRSWDFGSSSKACAMEVSWNGGTPSHHPFLDGGFPYKPSIFGVPPFMEPPIWQSKIEFWDICGNPRLDDIFWGRNDIPIHGNPMKYHSFFESPWNIIMTVYHYHYIALWWVFFRLNDIPLDRTIVLRPMISWHEWFLKGPMLTRT